MGDVFDAMNRARREKRPAGSAADGGQPAPGAASAGGAATPAGADRERALPLDEFVVKHPAAALAPDEPQTRPGRLAAEAPAKDASAEPPPPSPHDPASLNGYSPSVVVHHDRGSLITEQYRAIRTQILARARNRRLQIHTITSSAPEEGKSVTTANLGMAFSELRSQRTLLIEGDLRRPAFSRLFMRKAEPGLVHLLRGEIDDLDRAIHPTVYENLQFMPAGGRDFLSSTELLSSPRMAQVLDRLRDRYDHIFIDTPPVITVTDACILGAQSDETLLVVRLNRTPVELVERAKRLLRAANCEVAGVILTHMKVETSRYVYRYS